MDMLPLLEALNRLSDYYTTSSCSGRIQVYEAVLPGLKFDLKTIAKWHRAVEPGEIVAAIEAVKPRNAWLAVLPPILHVTCRSLDAANRLLHLARESSFKHSGLLVAKGDRFVVELTATERMESPLVVDGTLVFKPEILEKVVERANMLLKRSKHKISVLAYRLSGQTC
ncbi:hypothetical protein DRO58_04670 [Candidatus Bathyarchaeota archaeon]|nr:MAG: hypothetical protein DRO58_04670 [Candidatus Bathyarchaeota archaeon]